VPTTATIVSVVIVGVGITRAAEVAHRAWRPGRQRLGLVLEGRGRHGQQYLDPGLISALDPPHQVEGLVPTAAAEGLLGLQVGQYYREPSLVPVQERDLQMEKLAVVAWIARSGKDLASPLQM
jgi:hypothetical protein